MMERKVSSRVEGNSNSSDFVDTVKKLFYKVIMLLVGIGTASVILVVGLIIKNRRTMNYYLNWLMMHLKYNAVATKEIVVDLLESKKNKTELPITPGRTAIVTGGSRGIGLEIVKLLLQCDMEVIIACRNVSAGAKAIDTIRKSGVTTGKAKVMELDNSKLDSVRKFVKEYKATHDTLDILINNAGIMFTPYGETEDGFEQQYGVNYLSHFFLTLQLVPLMKKSESATGYKARIVNVSSCAHLLGKINFDDFNNKIDFNTGEAYAQSKLAQLMFTKKLARLFEAKKLPVICNAVHPGVVNTDLFENSFVNYLQIVKNAVFKSPAQGATSIVFAAVSPKVEDKTGLYFSNCQETSVNPIANDVNLQDRLFEITLKQVQMQSFIQDL